MTDTSTVLSFRASLRKCQTCELHEGCTAPVPWFGDTFAEICIVGEAPGRTEDREGRPFVGPAGARLRHYMKEVGIDIDDVAYTNAVQCFPDGTPTEEHVDVCNNWMRGQVAFIKPRFVISVGKVAFSAIRRKKWPELVNLHGRPMFWENPPAPAKPEAYWATYHPSAALRPGGKKYEKLILEDLAKFVAWRDGGRPLDNMCYINKCAGEVYRYDGWGIGYCDRHSARQGMLWPEDR